MKQESTTIDRIQCAQIDWAETPQKQSNTQWQDMQPEITCIETHNQVACITSMKICSDLNHFKIKWKILQKIVENNKAKIPWDFSIHKQVLANQPDIVAIDKNQKSAQVIYIYTKRQEEGIWEVRERGNIRKKIQKKYGK